MNYPGAGPGRNRVQVRHFLLPGIVWAAALFTAPFLNGDGGAALLWGAGAAVLVGLFPAVLIAGLQRRSDLRGSLGLPLPPVVTATAAMGFTAQWAILWLNGPLALSAVLFGLLGTALILLAGARIRLLSWTGLSCGAGAVILPVLLWNLAAGLPVPAAAAAVLALLAAVVAGLARTRGWKAALVSGAAGAAAGGGVFLWLLGYAG